MKSKVTKLLTLLLMSISICAMLSGCSAGSDKAYPITIGGTEVIVGETKVSTLLDAGFTFTTLVDGLSVDVAAEDMLEANSYYSSLFLQQSDSKSIRFCVTTDKDAVPFSDAVIAKVSLFESSDFSSVTFDGVALTDLTGDMIKEHIADVVERDDGAGFFYTSNNYHVDFDMADGVITEFDIERKYDVDYGN